MKLQVKEIVVLAMSTAVLFAVQVMLAFIPNVELVSLLIIIYTQVYKKKVFYIIYAFAILEGIYYGFGIWWFMYLYVWSILAIITLILIKQKSIFVWTFVSGIFGLVFGALCSIPYFIIGGIGTGVAYWIAGIPFDIIHGVGNTTVAIILYKPITYILNQALNLFYNKT